MIERLRAAHLLGGVGDELRLRVLLDRLAKLGVAGDGAGGAAKWLGPILCRSADQQQMLAFVLQQLDSEHRSKRLLAQPVPPQTAEESAIASQRKRNLWKIGLWIGCGTILAIALSAWLLQRPIAPAPAPDLPATKPCVPPECTPSSGSPTTPAAPAVGPWWSFELGVIPLTIVLTFLMIRQRRRVFLLRGLVPRQAPTLSRLLPARSDGLFRADRMRVPTADWRRHRWEDSQTFDPVASIARTTRTGGEPTIVRARRRVLPKYLLLVDRTGANDLLASVADHLMARLKAEQIDVARFDYRGDPRRLTATDSSGGRGRLRTLQELRGSYDEHQLIVLADAASAFDRASRAPRAWLSLLCEWPQPILMSPLPTPHQGAAERRLADLGFRVVEASSEGVAAIGRLMRRDDRSIWRYMAADRESALDAMLAGDAYRWTGDQPPPEGDVAALVEALEAGLDPKAFTLLAAIAVFPMTDTRLVLFAADQLAAALQWHHGLEGIIAEIGRLPWLRQGYLPEWLRVALVEWLERPERRALAATVRAMWLALLDYGSSAEAAAPAVDGDSRSKVRFDFARAYTPTMSERLLAAVRAKQNVDVEERVLIAFLTNTPVQQVALEAPVSWRDLAPKRWRTADVIVVSLGIVAAVALAASSKALTTLLGSLSDEEWEKFLVPPAYMALGLTSLVLMQSYLRQLPGLWNRLLGGATGSVLCALAICYSAFLTAVVGIKAEASFDSEILALFTPAIAYVVLWFNPSSFLRLRERRLVHGLLVDRPIVGVGLTTLLACTLAIVTADAVGGVTSWRDRVAPANLAFLSYAENSWLHVAVLLSLFATFAVTALRVVDVSISKTALVGFATLLVLGALSIVAALVAGQSSLDAIPDLPGWRWPASLSIAFVVALAVCVPLSVARWRNLDRTAIRYIYGFVGIAILLEFARAAVDGFDVAVYAELLERTLPDWRPSVLVWSLPILSVVGLLLPLTGGRRRMRPVPWFVVAVLWAVLAGAIYVASRNHAAFGEADRYVRFYLIPALAIGLELGTVPWVLVLANADPANDALLARLGPPPPSLAAVLRGVVGIGWPALSSAAMVVVAATFMAIYLPSAPKQPGSTQGVPPARQNEAPPPLELESFRTPVLASPTVLFDLNSVTLSPEALATIGGLAATFKKNRGASIILRGYADIAGDQKTDADIGAKRAAAVRDALIKDGVPGQSIFAQGFAAQPGTPTTQSSQARQRGRVDIFVLAAPSTPPSNQAAPSAPTKQQAPPSKK
jgi:outer membrane protein OmpA-like peptidoglycan-associated protein